MLTPLIDGYLAIRRAAGFQLSIHESLLRNYARFATARGDTHVRAQTALDWAAGAPSPYQRGRRLEVVRIFARHVRVEDARHEIPPIGVFSSKRSPYRPFICTQDQIHQLLEESAKLRPEGSLRPWTYCTLFSLLAVTGMRISEALALCLDDITEDGLIVRSTKFQKSRILPLHPTTLAGLRRYLQRRLRVAGTDDHLFVSLRHKVLCYHTVVATFLQIVRAIGLHAGAGHRGPRIHDLRHRWAVAALEASSCGIDQVSEHVLAVGTYLGHAKLASTYYYLHTTPELLAGIANRCESVAKGDQP